MSEVDDILKRSREARERIINAGQQYAAQKARLTRVEQMQKASLEQRTRLAQERAQTKGLYELRMEGMHTARLEVRKELYKILVSHNVYWPEIVAHTRKKHLKDARGAVYSYLRSLGWSLSKIAEFCNRDHSSILYALRQQEQSDD